MIPQTIHYAWFGGGAKTPLVERCLASFRQHCPEFELVEWNETSFDASRYPFAAHAAAQKRWAFVADVCRAVVMKEHGGFFLDADNELTASIQAFRDYDFVSGFESFRGLIFPITAFMGCRPGSQVASFLFDYYATMTAFRFQPNTAFIGDHMVQTRGFAADNSLQLRDGALLAPSWYFCTPVSGRPNYCIHHFNGSWVQS